MLQVLQQQIAGIHDSAVRANTRIDEASTLMVTMQGQMENRCSEIVSNFTALITQIGDRQTDLENRLATHSTTGGRSRDLVDPKTMVPEKLNGERGMAWKEWQFRVLNFIGLSRPSLQKAMLRAELHTNEIEDLSHWHVDPADDNQLRAFLVARTEGKALTIIRQFERALGLEQYRRLASTFDPQTDARRLDESRAIMYPGQAASLDDLAKRLPAWKGLYQRNLDRYGDTEALPEAHLKSILIEMLPTTERTDVLRHRHLWPTASDLEKHMIQRIHDGTRGPAPMLYSCDAEAAGEVQEDDLCTHEVESVYNEESGELDLYRVEIKKGKKIWGRKIGSKPASKDASGRTLCYRCGRPSHLARDCHATKHVNGGPCREKPSATTTVGARGKSGTNNLEEEEDATAPTETEGECVQLAGVELFPLEFQELDVSVASGLSAHPEPVPGAIGLSVPQEHPSPAAAQDP